MGCVTTLSLMSKAGLVMTFMGAMFKPCAWLVSSLS